MIKKIASSYSLLQIVMVFKIECTQDAGSCLPVASNVQKPTLPRIEIFWVDFLYVFRNPKVWDGPALSLILFLNEQSSLIDQYLKINGPIQIF